MKKLLILFIISIILSGSTLVYGEETSEAPTKKILVFHSYHQGLSWTDEFQRGIEEGLESENVEITVEYMDSYRYNYKSYKKELFDYYTKKYKDKKFDQIIVCDNFANDFMKLYYDQLFQGIPVVFGGINDYSAEDIFTQNSTGIAQTSSQEDTISLILKLHPSTDTILVCGSPSATGLAEADAIVREGSINHPEIMFKSVLKNDLEGLLDWIKSYGKNTVIITAGTILRLNGDFLDHSELSAIIITETELPVYAMAKSYIIDMGAIGGVAVDSYVHGGIIAEFTKKILSGTAASELPIIEQPIAEYIFNYKRLQQFKINEALLPRTSVIIEGPSMKVIVNKYYIYMAVITILIMALLISGILINQHRRKKAEKIMKETTKKLEIQNVELENSNGFLKKSKEQLNKQNEELIEKNERIEFLAYYDNLTLLMKREKLSEMLADCIAEKKAVAFAIYNIDLGNIKTINDTYGHGIGNEILVKVSKLLKMVMNDEACLIGMHHSEFLIVDFNIQKVSEALHKTNKITEELLKTIKVNHKEIDLETNIGISLYPLHGVDTTSLLTNANIAMMEAIKKGKNNSCVYEEVFYFNIINRLEMEKQLKKALQYHEFELFYQPKVDTKRCEILGCEALIRWRHPDGHLVYPMKFIEMAEETGSIVPIGDWVIFEACRQMKVWQLMGLKMNVSVNVSPRQLAGTHLLEVIKEALEVNDIEASYLELEITETAMMADVKNNAQLLLELRNLGVGIALDDFGTGYSSMNYIKELPITKLKIDKSFIDNIEELTQREIIKSIIDLGQALNYVINIEGVERLEQFKILQQYKADEIQGFLFSKALPKDEFLPFVQQFREKFTTYYE